MLSPESTFTPSPDSLFDSPPVLQHPSPHGMTVAWAVKTTATGWVEYGPTPELGQRADAPMYGQHIVSDRFFHIRINELRPGQTIYYRIAAAPVTFKERFLVECGEPQFSPIYSFTTFDSSRPKASFAVINDLHEREETLLQLMPMLLRQSWDFTIWNGDLFGKNTSAAWSQEQIVEAVLRPVNAIYAAQRPVIFTTGNHDLRGPCARMLTQAVIPWESELPMGRCFAVRQGPLAIIGLDTAEMRIDSHPGFGGLSCVEPYIKAQRDWLQKATQRPEIASAPHLLAVCHIPLWVREDRLPLHIQEGRMQYSEPGQKYWHSLLEEAGVQVLISGHKHYFHYSPPCARHSYAQLVTGGPSLEQATLVAGEADENFLKITVRNLENQKIGS